MSTPKTIPWKTIAIGFIILTVAFGAIAGAAVSQMTSLSNDKTNLQNQYNALKILDAQNNQTITSLKNQLQGNATLLASLKTQLSKLEAPNVIATIQWSHVASSPPICILGICFGGNDGSATVDAIAYANLGTTDTMATVTVSFYSTPTASATPLCTTPPIALGIVKGQTIYGLISPMGGSCTWPEPPPDGTGVDALSYTIQVTLS